jgi:hypothetical protein
MRFRAAIVISACSASLAACAVAAPKGPDTTVTTPAVGKPAPPTSVDAVLTHAPFSPYALLGTSDNDGLAPGESSYALAGDCMTAAGFLNAASYVPMGFRISPGLGISQPWGQWGYLGVTEAEQSGFRATPGSALADLGIAGPGLGGGPPANLPAAEQAALGKCGTIVMNFTNAQGRGSLTGIQAIANDIGTDVSQDPAVRSATKAWSACMSANGFSYADPGSVFSAAIQDMYGQTHSINFGAPVSPAANQAQLALATADAKCTQTADLAGIYFAVQTSYEQQLVDANQQALTAAVHRYRAAYQKELKHLTALLRTAKASRFHSPKASGPASNS